MQGIHSEWVGGHIGQILRHAGNRNWLGIDTVSIFPCKGFLWAIIEVNTGLICACVPTLKPFFWDVVTRHVRQTSRDVLRCRKCKKDVITELYNRIDSFGVQILYRYVSTPASVSSSVRLTLILSDDEHSKWRYRMTLKGDEEVLPRPYRLAINIIRYFDDFICGAGKVLRGYAIAAKNKNKAMNSEVARLGGKRICTSTRRILSTLVRSPRIRHLWQEPNMPFTKFLQLFKQNILQGKLELQKLF